MIKEDLTKYIIKDFIPLQEYINKLDNSITFIKITTIKNKNTAFFEYQYHQKLKMSIQVSITPNQNKLINFNFYNLTGEKIETIDFLLRNELDSINIIRYSACFFEDNIAKIVNSVYGYKNNLIVSGYRDKSIVNYEDGKYLSTIALGGLENMHCNLKQKKIKCLSKSREKLNETHSLELHY